MKHEGKQGDFLRTTIARFHNVLKTGINGQFQTKVKHNYAALTKILLWFSASKFAKVK